MKRRPDTRSLLITPTELAVELQISRGTIAGRLRGIPVVEDTGRARFYQLGPAVRAALQVDSEIDEQAARARAAKARAELAELSLAEQRGELVDARDMEEQAFAFWRAERVALEEFLGQLAPALAAELDMDPARLSTMVEERGRAFLVARAENMERAA